MGYAADVHMNGRLDLRAGLAHSDAVILPEGFPMDAPDVTAAQIGRMLQGRLSALGLIAPAAQLRRLVGGRTNFVWRVAGTQGPLICKVSPSGRDTPLFPNLPESERKALKTLHDSGLAPVLVASLDTPHGPCVIYRACPGRTCACDPALAGAVLARLHVVAPPKGLRRVSSRAADVMEQGDGMLAEVTVPGPLIAVRPSTDSVAECEQEGPLRFLHGDPVPGNIVVARGRAVLIDWQCPALGDPIHDLALFLSPAMQILGRGRPLSSAERDAFLTAYDDDRATRRLANAEPALTWRMAVYCAWRIARGQHDYATALQAELDHLHQLH